jgi:membrane protein
MKASLVGPRLIATLQAWPWLATLRMLAHRFGDERLALTAGGLTFATIISLVPLVTVMLALFSAFPIFSAMEEALQKYFLQALVPDAIARPVLNAINQFSTRASRLGIVGLVALVFSAIAMMLTIDRALNAIWRVRKPRPIAHRVLVYWAAVTLGPLLAAASLAATSYAVSASRGFVGTLPRGMGALVWTIEFVLHVLAVAALFHYVPNTHVRWRHALAGGLFVAVGMAAAKRLMTLYFSAVPSFSMIYGAFATLPIFLVWIYLGWVIVLLGAVIAAYAPLLGRHLSRWTDAPGSQFHLALALVAKLLASRRAGQRGLTGDQLAAAVGTDALQSEPVLETLVGLDWVGRLAEAGNARFVLLCDPETTRAEPLVARLLLEPEPDLARLWTRTGFAEMTLGEILPSS